jgi:hypothetical protein
MFTVSTIIFQILFANARFLFSPNYFLMKPFRRPHHLRGQSVPSDEEIVEIGRPQAATAEGGSLFFYFIFSISYFMV